MKRIDIVRTEDLRKLENLHGRDTYYVKIHRKSLPRQIRAIDLEKFHGKLEIVVDDTDHYYEYFVKTTTRKHLYFFDNVRPGQICMNASNLLFHYKPKVEQILIKHEEDLEKALLFHKNGKYVTGVLESDCGLSKNIVLPKDFSLKGNGHILFVPRSIYPLYKNIKNLQSWPYDHFLKVSCVEDLKEMLNWRSGFSYVEWYKDIVGQELSSLCLEQFLGSCYINGMGHGVFNSTIHGNGFISSLPKVSNLFVGNLHIHNVSYLANSDYKGGFLGDINNEKNMKYVSTPGLVQFLDCSVRNCFFGDYNVSCGAFVGRSHENVELWRCFYDGNFDQKRNVKRAFGTELFFLSENMSSSDISLDYTRLTRERF